MKIRFTTTLNDDVLKQAKIRAKDEGVGANEIIEKALDLYFSNSPPTQQVWEKALESGWIKKFILLDGAILFENIKFRKNITGFKHEDYTEESLISRGWKKV